MKILKTIILISSIILTSCEKEIETYAPKNDIKPYPTDNFSNTNVSKVSQWLNVPGGYATFTQLDFNNDGVDDVVSFDGYDTNVPYNWPGPQFYIGNPLYKIYPNIDNNKVFASKMISADFDGNGYKDVFLMSGMDPAGCNNCSDPILPNNIMFNVDGKSFKVKELSDWKGIWRSSSAADIDNDKDMDLLIFSTHQGKGLYNKLLINDGKGNFNVKVSDIDQIGWVDVTEMFDINRDGFVDLLINDVVESGNRFRILWGNGDNFFQSKSIQINIPNNMWVLDIDAFDFDKDGYDEIIVTMNYPNGNWKLNMYKTKDNKNYIDITDDVFDNNPKIIAYSHLIDIGDVDGNGKTDVYVNDKNKNIRWEFDSIDNKLKRK